MSILEGVRLWLRALFRRRDVERDLDREMRFHLEMEIEQNVRAGFSEEEARRRARLAFGGIDRHKESVRDERGTRWLDDALSDARLAARSLKKHPGFTATAVLTMGLGIGAATAVFSLANTILLRPVAGVVAPDELVSVSFDANRNHSAGASLPTLIDLARMTPALAALTGTQPTTVQFSVAGAPARSLDVEAVAGDYFGTLGIRPQIGRFFSEDEQNARSDARVVVISDNLWRRELGGSPTVLGASIRVNGTDYTIVGVAARRFVGTERVGETEAWLPPSSYRLIRHNANIDASRRGVTAFHKVVGRLRRGATVAQAEQQMRAQLDRLGLLHPEAAERYKSFPPVVTPGVGTSEYARPFIQQILKLLAIVVAVVLLVSCANAANLLLVRGVARRGEMAVRRAMGASTSRLIRLHLAEGVVLGVLGAACGILVAGALGVTLRNQSLPWDPAATQLSIDHRVLLFAAGLAIAVGVLFAVIPAVLAVGGDHLANLKEASRSDTGGRTARIRRGLVVVQIAASMTLVVTGVLFARTLRALYRVDVGMDAAHTTAFLADPSQQGYDAARVARFRNEVLSELRMRPGIEAATFSSNAPFSGAAMIVDLRPSGFAGKTWPVSARAFHVSPDYFETLRIPLIAGVTVSTPRQIAETVTSGTSYDVVISRSTARRLFGEAYPIGRLIEERTYDAVLTHRVIGISGDVRTDDLKGDHDLVMYGPAGASRLGDFGIFVVRSPLAPAEVERLVRDAVARVDAAVPVARSYLIDDGIARSIARERLFATLVSTLATLAAILMAVGLYSVIAYFVAQRTQEIGVRMAMGATAFAVVKLVGKQSLWLVVAGVALGTASSMAFSRLVTTWLFGVTPLSISSYAAAATILVVLGTIAGIAPARAATSINPVDALKHE